MSEALSYYNVAYHQDWFQFKVDPSRISTEIFAKDSFENILFSICRFYELTRKYPSRITIVGFEFKKKRFVELHRPALRFPLERFSYVGIDPMGGLQEAQLGEVR